MSLFARIKTSILSPLHVSNDFIHLPLSCSYILGKPRHLVYKRRFNRNVDQSMSTRRKSASNVGMPGDDRLSQIAEKFSMDMFQMQRAASREEDGGGPGEVECRLIGDG